MKNLILGAAALIGISATSVPPPVQLYTLDCGRIDLPDLKAFADTGEHDGQSEVMPVPCFLVHHGRDWLLWDVGLGDDIANSPQGRMVVGLRFHVPMTLASQLRGLSLRPDDIRYVALSHLHADHSGNVRLFPHATFLIAAKELAWARRTPTPDGVRPDVVASLGQSRIDPVEGDRDVFGDGSVRILDTPGHTPGHHSLMLQLHHTGTVILSGDVAHFVQNYDQNLVPLGNSSRAETIASIGRIKGLAANHHARVVIQHAVDVFDTLPKLPAYLD